MNFKSKMCLIVPFSIICVLCLQPAVARSAETAPAASYIASANLSPEKLEAKWKKVAADELRKAAEGGNAEAQYMLGLREWDQAYEDNRGAFQWSFKAIADGNNATPDELKQSREKWEAAPEADLLKAAEAGDRGALLYLGRSRKDRASERGRKAFDWLKRAADQSFALAEFELAARYLGRNGWDIIPFDTKEGLKWERRAAEHGYESAIHALADLYLAGRLVPPDLLQGIQCLESAAAAGCKRAQYELARQYANGNGEPAGNDLTPVALLKKSAASGYSLAQHALAERYRTGVGVSVNYIKAIQMYQAAVEADAQTEWKFQSHAEGIFELVDEHFQPKFPLTLDFVHFAEILGLYLRATEKGEAAAMNQIGQLYLDGRFEPREPAQAYRWFNFASEHGSSSAAAARDKLKSSLTAEQMREAAEPLPKSSTRKGTESGP